MHSSFNIMIQHSTLFSVQRLFMTFTTHSFLSVGQRGFHNAGSSGDGFEQWAKIFCRLCKYTRTCRSFQVLFCFVCLGVNSITRLLGNWIFRKHGVETTNAETNTREMYYWLTRSLLYFCARKSPTVKPISVPTAQSHCKGAQLLTVGILCRSFFFFPEVQRVFRVEKDHIYFCNNTRWRMEGWYIWTRALCQM